MNPIEAKKHQRQKDMANIQLERDREKTKQAMYEKPLETPREKEEKKKKK